MIFLIDFDGTVIPKIPGIGYSNFDTGAEKVLKKIISSGHEIVLFTCRNNSITNPYNYHKEGVLREETSLEEAIRWFKERNIKLSGVNTSPEQEKYIGESQKALGDIIIDDICIGIPKKIITTEWISYETGETEEIETYCVDWDKIEKELQKQKLI